MSTGLPTLAAAGRNARSAAAVSGASGAAARAPAPRRRRPRGSPGRRRWSGSRRGRPRGTGWCASSTATSKSSSSVSGADDAGLAEERVDDRVRSRRARRCARTRRARRPRERPGLDRDDRLAPRDAARDPREVARISEALEVEQDHVGPRVLGPVLDRGRCPRRRPCCPTETNVEMPRFSRAA